MLRMGLRSRDPAKQSTPNNDEDLSSPVRPTFFHLNNSPLSTKREKMSRTPLRFNGSVPRCAKTAPALSKMFPRRFASQKPHLISSKSLGHELLSTPVYNPASEHTFFDQCFTCEGKLGEGSFGEVFAVFSKEDGRRYAVKRAMSVFRNQSDRSIKLREVKRRESLPPHPNLLTFIKAWEERGRLYIQTELCSMNLAQYCEGKELPEHETWNYFIDLLSAVEHLHSHDLIHVDIKPDNILLTSDRICKLGDFGLAFDLKSDDVHTAEEGDSKYLAAEVLNGVPTKEADIFSVGITILEISTDLLLPSQGEWWHKLRKDKIPETFLSKIGPDLRRLILMMMSHNPKNRPTASELLNDEVVRVKRFSRNRQIRVHEMKSTVVNYSYSIWTWIVAFFSVIIMFFGHLFELLRQHKEEAYRTPFRGNQFFENDSDIKQITPTENLLNGRNPQLDWSFSDEEQFTENDNRFARSALPRRKPDLFSSSRFMDESMPCCKLNFDDDIEEDSPTSSSDPSESIQGSFTKDNDMPLRSPSPKKISPESRPILRRSPSRVKAMTAQKREMGSGDWTSNIMTNVDDSDGGEYDHLSAQQLKGYYSCPTRALRKRRLFGKPLPRLNWGLLDSPCDELENDSTKSNSSLDMKRADRMITDRYSSTEE